MLRTPPDFAGILEAIHSANADFILIGGLAMVAHGSDHITRDIDFFIPRDRINSKLIADALAPLNPRPEGFPNDLPYVWDVDAIWRSTILTLLTEKGSLDLLQETSGVTGYADLLSRAKLVEIFGYPVHVASIDDLIAMKRAANRVKDQLHVLELLALKRVIAEEGDGVE